MDYTCENCKQRHAWDCDDGGATFRCDNFELDETTLSESEREMLRVMRNIMREKNL